MLLQFNFKNFLSFKEEGVLNLLANGDKEHSDYLIEFGKRSVLPCVAIYGANASGKSNVNKALAFCVNLVRNSYNFQVNTPISVIPFLLDQDSKNDKSRFDFDFVYNNVRYKYGFVLDQKNIYDEYLYEYKSLKPTTIFIREDIDKYTFTMPEIRRQLESLTQRTSNNKLFLSVATAWNSNLTKNAYMWFAEGIDIYDHEGLKMNFHNIIEKNNNQMMKDFIISFLNNVDINISDYNLEIASKDISNIPLPPGLKFDQSSENIKNNFKEIKLSTKHIVEQNGVCSEYQLPFMLESQGTINSFYLAPFIKEALEKSKTIVIDELDSGLHPSIVRYLISIFNSKVSNPNESQLIFNTHDVTQLDLDIFRRDQIYFVEKDVSSGSSDLYSLDEYSPRKSENIQKGYMQGRYGAIPVIGADGLKWEK